MKWPKCEKDVVPVVRKQQVRCSATVPLEAVFFLCPSCQVIINGQIISTAMAQQIAQLLRRG